MHVRVVNATATGCGIDEAGAGAAGIAGNDQGGGAVVRKNNFQILEPMIANSSQTMSDVWYS
jgi:hypothetical protein